MNTFVDIVTNNLEVSPCLNISFFSGSNGCCKDSNTASSSSKPLPFFCSVLASEDSSIRLSSHVSSYSYSVTSLVGLSSSISSPPSASSSSLAKQSKISQQLLV